MNEQGGYALILTIHIDNRTISLGVYAGEKRIVCTAIGTDLTATPDQYAASIHTVLAFLKADTDALEGAVISSVVPALSGILQAAAKQLCSGKVLVIGAGIKTGLNLRLDSAGTVGSDFICNAVAALQVYAPPLVVVHLAGATTLTAIDAQGILIGRAVLPGIESSLAHLCQASAQLPDISFDPRAPLIGRSTADAIKAGAFYGTVSMLEGMLERYVCALGKGCTIVATGELVPHFLPVCRPEIVYRPNLLHDGLYLLYQKNR